MSRDMCALQVQQGADVLDINMDDGLIEGVGAMTKFVNLCISGGWRGLSPWQMLCGAQHVVPYVAVGA